MCPMPWDFALVLLVLGIVVPLHGALRIRELLTRPSLDTRERLSLYASTVALQWLATGVIAWRCYARGLTPQQLALSYPQPERTTAITLGLSLALAASQILSLRRLARVPADRQGLVHRIARLLLPQNLVESLAFVALTATVALCEEFIYRGFVFSALFALADGSQLPAAAGSSALFALAHLYQGARGVGLTFGVGLLFAAARITTGSLGPSILAHFIADLLAGMLAPRLLRQAPTALAAESNDAEPPAPNIIL